MQEKMHREPFDYISYHHSDTVHTLPHSLLCGLLHSAHLFSHCIWGRGGSPHPLDVCLLPW